MTRKLPFVAAHWGAYRAEMADGHVRALLPFEDDPDPSPIGQAMVETLDDPCRIAQPMVRRGFLEGNADRSLRGRDSFVPVEWDEALDLAASELLRVRRDHSNEAIYAGSYGWASAGRFHHAQSQLRRFMNLFGGFTSARDSYSYAAAEVIMPHVLAPMKTLLVEHGTWQDIADKQSLIVAFGGIAPRNGQVNGGGVAKHTQRGDMAAALKAGAEIVTINPSALDIDAAFRDQWLPIRPNTDLALMLGLAHTLVARGLYDQVFVDSHCTGFEAFRPYLVGQSDGQPKSAEWAAFITGVPAGRIVDLALQMARRPTVVNFSWSMTRQQNGEDIIWMAVVLAALLGGIGSRGEGVACGLSAVNSVGNRRGHLPVAALPTGSNPVRTFIPVARIADMLLNPGGRVHYNGELLTYPDIRLVYWAGGNPFHHHQDLNRLRRAWERIETVIVHEPHWTPLARFADIVFPATVSMERNDLSGSPQDTHLFATSVVAKPFRQCRHDHDIFAGLAARVTGPTDADSTLFDRFTEGRSEAEWLEELYDRTVKNLAATLPDMPSYDEFRAVGTVSIPVPEHPERLLESFRADPERNPLATPSGRIEIFSNTIAGFGRDGLAGHPMWRDPAEWHGASLARKFPLHLVTHQPDRRLHSQLDQSSHSRAGKIAGRAACVINASDADARGIGEGDIVEVFNDRGRCLAGASLSRNVRKGVLLMATGSWYDPDWETGGDLCKHGNPNVLTADLPTSEIAQGPGALTCLVDIRKPAGDIPPVTAFDAPWTTEVT